MDILSLKLFLLVAKHGGISDAARLLTLSPASASARLVKLESQVGFRLFNRTTRAVSLTSDGEAFLPYAQQSLETLETGLGTVSGEGELAQGVLRMTMPGSFSRMHIIPRLAGFSEQYPNVRLDMRLSDEVLDVVEGAYDLIIRNAPLADSSLIARKLADDKRILVASPAYLAKHGMPRSPDDLLNHVCVTLANGDHWKFKHGQVLKIPASLVVNDGEAMRTMLVNGMGIGIKSRWNAYQCLADKRLVEVLPEYPLKTESAIWALHQGGRIINPKVRVMIDFLLSQFQPSPPWESDG